jgi:hypothetical protein
LLNQKEVKIMGQNSLSLSLSLSEQVIRERGESLTQLKDLLTLEKRQKGRKFLKAKKKKKQSIFIMKSSSFSTSFVDSFVLLY